jgi:tetratricopeptide (TPR) repeat protein
MKKLKPSSPIAEHFGRTLAGLGNLTILDNHISKLEERLNFFQGPLSASENLDYYCWLLLNANYIYHMIEYKYFRCHKERSVTEHIRFENLIDSLKKDLKKAPDYESNNWRYIHTVIELRHKLSHLGVPNFVVESKKDPKFLRKIILEGDIKEAKKYFEKAKEILNRMLDPVVVLPGIAQIGM